ncbi:MAG: hypothetical protein ACI9A2_003227 [Halioglobus sp.]|jgi:hypothetical protein
MPVEIKELVIRTVVSDADASADSDDSTESGDLDSEAMIQECVRQVMKILAQNKER